MLRHSIVLAAILILGACSSFGNLTSVHKRSTIGGGFGSDDKAPAGVFIDAEQRAVLSNFREGREMRVVCAEPAPDALSAIAAQAGVSVADLSNSISADGGVSEAAANIGLRTQTIQTLRDGFYRLCEAYMNGLSEEQYALMLRRFQTNMIALLAIEQLTGSVRGSDAVVSASAGTALDFREQYLQRSAIASAEASRLEAEISDLDDEIASLESAQYQCEGNTNEDGCSIAEQENRADRISRAKTRRRSLQASLSNAQATEETNRELADTAPSASDAQAGGVTGSWPPSTGGEQTDAVAAAVRDISMTLLRQDYGIQLCFEHLRSVSNGAAASTLAEKCDNMMDAYVRQFEITNELRLEMQEAKLTILEAVLTRQVSLDEAAYLSEMLNIADARPTGRTGVSAMRAYEGAPLAAILPAPVMTMPEEPVVLYDEPGYVPEPEPLEEADLYEEEY